MVCEISGFISEFAKKIPSSGDEQFIFSSDTLPQVPESLSTDKIIVGKAYHSYQSYTNSKVDLVSFQAHKEIYKCLGLLILSKVFHEAPFEVNIKLTHPSSVVKKIVLDYEHPTDENTSSGYYSKPYKFIYIPSDLISRHPFVYYKKHLLPLFNLTNEVDCIATDEDWNNRNTIRCAGLDRGNVLFAELLLNFSRPQEQLNELILEGELGYQSVGTGSAEVGLYLPGSLGWNGDL